METEIEKFFMLNSQTQKHHTNLGGGVIKHFPDTCNTYQIRKQEILTCDPRDKEKWNASFGLPTETRIVPSSKGFVVVLYFDQSDHSHIVFVAQIDSKRGAWQNLPWDPKFQFNWNEKRVKETVNNFLWVAECEEAKEILPKRNYV